MIPEELYVDYKNELRRISGVEEKDFQEIRKWAIDEQLSMETRYKLTYGKDNSVAGFIFWREFGDECEIGEMYIKPSERRKGLGKELVESVIKPYRYITLCVIPENKVAKRFWHSVFKNDNGYRIIEDCEIAMENNEKMRLFRYMRKSDDC